MLSAKWISTDKSVQPESVSYLKATEYAIKDKIAHNQIQIYLAQHDQSSSNHNCFK